jgi:hypothetical protein
MKCSARRAAAAITLMAASWPAGAQSTEGPAAAAPAAAMPTAKAPVAGVPTTEATDAARALVGASRTGGLGALSGLVLPFPKLLSEMGVQPGPRFPVAMRQAVLPVIFEHADDFTVVQVHSYSTLLSLPDMKAATAFYNSPAGQDIVRLRPLLIQREAGPAFKLIATLHPEIDTKVQQTLKAHGWSKG